MNEWLNLFLFFHSQIVQLADLALLISNWKGEGGGEGAQAGNNSSTLPK